VDSHTGLADHREAREWLDGRLREAELCGDPLSIALVDIDRMRSVNGVFGVAVGDAMICRVADLLRSATGANDLAARVGGDEFLLAWVGDDADEAAAEVDDLRRRFEAMETELVIGARISGLTLSAGIAQLPNPIAPALVQPAEIMLAQADLALDTAKRAGGNCVRIA
jgi:diguanylate cyclase (GGDEF)-like protein